MPDTVDVHAAKAHFSSMLERVGRGEENIITRSGTPIARLAPITPIKRSLGFVHAEIDPSFFDPLPEDELAAWGESQGADVPSNR